MVALPFSRHVILLTIIAILNLITISKQCAIKFSNAGGSASIWDRQDWPRNKQQCECGTHKLSNKGSTDKTPPPPWNVYVQTKIESGQMKTCIGTIVNSNMIVTSHKCLLRNQHNMRLVDILKFKTGTNSIARKEDITVTTTRDIASATASQKFTVDKIWYNPKFALTSELQRKNASVRLEDDLVLIKVSTDFMADKKFQLICIQPYNQNVENIRETGHFYAYTTADDDENVSPMPANTEDVEVYEGEVRKWAACRKEEVKDPVLNKTLCFKHLADDKNRTEGGPLIVTSEDRSFLIGVATKFPDSSIFTGREASIGMEQTYFTAIGPVVRFIEYFSQKSDSKWCNSPTPKFKATAESGQDRTYDTSGPQDKGRSPWPWETMQQPIVRDEVLNCVCGEANFKIMGRIVGGVEATPREFGWMAVLHLYPNGKSGGGALCGGSVITDRIILTAAHCVVVDKWVYEGKRKVAIDPKNIDVTLNAHLRRGDPQGKHVQVSAVLFHPEYLNSRLGEPEYYDADIALLVLKDPLTFPLDGPGIRPICLHKYGEYENVVDRSAWVVGWGLTDPKDRGSAADTLQKLQVPIAELSYCSNVARSKVTDNFLCAGTLNMYKDAASGDSGGPLQVQDTETRQWYQVGAVSWGEDVQKGTETLTAALYADVQKLLPFIDYHARRLDAKWCKTKRAEEKEEEEKNTNTESSDT